MYRTPKMTSDWTKQAEWMRAVGATSATWELVDHVEGGIPTVSPRLVQLTLGPVPHAPKTQPEPDQDEEPKQGAVTARRIGSVPGRVPRSVGGSNQR